MKHSSPVYYYDKYHELLSEEYMAGDDGRVEVMLAEFSISLADMFLLLNPQEVRHLMDTNTLYRNFAGLVMLYDRDWNELCGMLRDTYHADILPENAFYDHVMNTISTMEGVTI